MSQQSLLHTNIQIQPWSFTVAGGSQSEVGFSNTIPVFNTVQYFTQDGQVFYMPYTDISPTHLSGGLFGGSYAYSPGIAYASQAADPGMMPYAQAQQKHVSDLQDKDVLGTDSRRWSHSTNESASGSFDRSPIYSTPSPPTPHNLKRPQSGDPRPYRCASINCDTGELVQQNPTIPSANSMPRGNARILEQNLNVYISGLNANTNDKTLAAYAAHYGRVDTAKAVIDTYTGDCRGFGFVKYFDARDSERCIQRFCNLGYNASFAKKSTTSQLKARGDPNSTKLYISNLPKGMDAIVLASIFKDYNVTSSRVLHNSQGYRGVGFANFETHDICEDVIKKFHNQPIGNEGLHLQVRYADTPSQKEFKKSTNECRQFRTWQRGLASLQQCHPPVSCSGEVKLITSSETTSGKGALDVAAGIS